MADSLNAASAWLGWIPGLPLAAFAILILVGRRLGRLSAWVSILALAGSCAITLSLAEPVLHGHRLALPWVWLPTTQHQWVLGLAMDELSWLMLFVVTAVGMLIQCYSVGYMHDDPRFSRFFAYLSLFCASMLGLVMADHFVSLYACWELVGLCSYLLISFWFEKPAAAAAGRKAFITTRIGDTGLLLGILLLAWTAGDLRFAKLEAIRLHLFALDQQALLTLINLLIFLGAVGKSAQLPLHVWLPDAMEGPAPVSALIHAATMVAAGVYLVARTLPLFTPESLSVVLAVGLATHLFAGTIALTMTDIKRCLAYSTISQLGLMMTALGLGALTAAMFHLVTHAFFKALLFLGAGSVIHATHQQDLKYLGRLFRAMPWTALTFLIAALAMSGVFPLGGFWSKDAILLEARASAPWLFVCLLGGSLMTAAYIFRLYFRCFHGPVPPAARGGSAAHQAHESPAIMVVPLVLLAIGAAFVGLLGAPVTHHWIFHLFDLPASTITGQAGMPEGHEGFDLGLLGLSSLVAGFGMWLAWQVGLKARRVVPAALRPISQRLVFYAANKYFVDELYDRFIIQPFLRLTQRLSRFDLDVIDEAVNRTGIAGRSISALKDWIDRYIVDGLVNGLAQGVRFLSALGRRLQTGVVQQYLFVIVAAVVVLSLSLQWF